MSPSGEMGLEASMSHPLRWYLPEVPYEVTIRTVDGKFWLRADAACRGIVTGVFGKALQMYPRVCLHAFEAMPNHLHYLLSSSDGEQIAAFINYVHSNIARQVNALRGRTGYFWSRRGRVITVVDDDALVQRLRYIVAQGPAAGLVASPTQWPGATSTHALVTNMVVPAAYTSQDALTRNAKLAAPRPVAELAEPVDIYLTPIRPWADLAPLEIRAKHAEMISAIEAEHRGRPVLGVRALRAQSPHQTPRNFCRSSAPACHASSLAARKNYLAQYRTFRSTFAAASARVREHRQVTTLEILQQYPPGAIPRPRWYVRPPDAFTPPWVLYPSSSADASSPDLC